MGLDIKLFRDADKGGNPKLVEESQKRRFPQGEAQEKALAAVAAVRAADSAWTQHVFDLNEARRQLNAHSKAFGKMRRAGEDTAALAEQIKATKESIKALEAKAKEEETRRDALVAHVGNIVHEHVPVSHTEDDNAVVRTHGERRTRDAPGQGAPLRMHYELLHMIDGYDPQRGTLVSGHRGYFLRGMGVRLNQAIIALAQDMLRERHAADDHPYVLLEAPVLMKGELMAKTAQLDDFDEMLYKVETPNETKYLIATAEQPISAMHAGEWIQPADLPLRYAGYSHCFRKEAGKAGVDLRGIFRVHQFQKVEQFCVTTPEDSWAEFDRMIGTAEAFYQALGLPYQVVAIVSGALNNAAAMKYDLEGWFPACDKYRELVSCSNCTDYQSRALEVRCGFKKKGEREKKYVHMLNSTMCANTRVMCAILENYQTEDGIVVPDVLQPYMGGLKKIPFAMDPPVEKEVKSKGGKKK